MPDDPRRSRLPRRALLWLVAASVAGAVVFPIVVERSDGPFSWWQAVLVGAAIGVVSWAWVWVKGWLSGRARRAGVSLRERRRRG